MFSCGCVRQSGRIATSNQSQLYLQSLHTAPTGSFEMGFIRHVPGNPAPHSILHLRHQPASSSPIPHPVCAHLHIPHSRFPFPRSRLTQPRHRPSGLQHRRSRSLRRESHKRHHPRYQRRHRSHRGRSRSTRLHRQCTRGERGFGVGSTGSAGISWETGSGVLG